MHGTPQSDHTSCAKTLTDLHRLGLFQGDLSEHSFLIVSNGVSLIDFKRTRKSEYRETFGAEIEALIEQMNDALGIG